MMKSLKSLVAELLADSWQELGFRGQLASIEVKPSERPEFGDFSSNIALVGAKKAKMAPHKLAEHLVPRLPEGTFSRVEVAGPGFINLFLLPEAIQSQLREILKGGDQFGRVTQRAPTEIQIEFVSSNPTGPLTVGHGRQAVLGDVLASLYEALGYNVTREYYFNDEGRQIELLTDSFSSRVIEHVFETDVEIPENGYSGEYLKTAVQELKDDADIRAIMDRIRSERRDYIDRSGIFVPSDRDTLRTHAIDYIKTGIRRDLELLGVHFDTWFSERTLHERGDVSAALQALQKQDGVYEKDGAIWLKAEEHGGVKDSVLIRSDGRPTYLMVDIAYHVDKRRRNFQHVINVQGADHQVEQSSMKAAMRILGYPEDFLDYALHQFVSIKEGEKSAARMSTRAGRFILLSDLVKELGRDVVRYFMVARKPESHLEFDLDLARAESMDNPVYYIQYAHTRIASIFRKAGVSEVDSTEVDLSPLRAKEELDLIKRLDRFPEVVEEAALGFAPHLLADYALSLARVFHPYYTDYRVIGKDKKVMWARLALLRGVQTVFRNCLEILGMSVPETM